MRSARDGARRQACAEDLLQAPGGIRRVDPERMRDPAGDRKARVPPVPDLVAEAEDPRVLPEGARVGRGSGDTHRSRPAPAVARRGAREPGSAATWITRR